MRLSRFLSTLAVLAASLLGVAQAQSDRPQFRTGVELYQLDVTVLDDKRLPVRGLKEGDFSVLVNGLPTPVRAFTAIEVVAPHPRRAAVWSSDAPVDVVTNEVGEHEGRLVVILIDRSIPVHEPAAVAKRVASAAVAALGPHDLGAVVSTRNNAVQNGSVQNFTADRARLLRAIEQTDPSTGISREAESLPTMGRLDPLQDGQCLCGLCVPETIQRVAEALENTPRRRKMLLFIGTNAIWQSMRPAAAAGQDVGCETRIKDARNAMFAAVDRANLTVHAIDPQGLTNIGPQTRADALSQPNPSVLGGRSTTSGTGPSMAGGPGTRLGQLQTDLNEAMTNRQNLQVLPERTGGRTVVGMNRPEEIVPAIFRESEAYYVLAIERPVSSRPDEARSIEVKVARRGVRVYTQRKYASAQLDLSTAVPPTSVSEAFNRLVPSAVRSLVLGVVVSASPSGPKAFVRLNLDARTFAPQNGAAVPLEVSTIAVDRNGRPVASAKQTSTLSGSGPTGKEAAAADVNLESYLELEPGDYEVRVAVSEPSTATVASVFADVTVPRFHTAPLSLSDIAVEIARSPPAPPRPTTRRVFRRGDNVRAVVQIYQGTERTEPVTPVLLRVRVLNSAGTAARDQALTFAAEAFESRRADAVITLPLANLPAGEYLLKLEASANDRGATRALRFAVE